MKHVIVLAVITSLSGSVVSAQDEFQGMAQDALGDAQTFTDYSQDTAEDVLGVPVETDLPQSDMLPGDLEDAGLLTTTTDTTEGNTFGAMSDNITDWGVASFDQSLLGAADAAIADPNALIDPSTFSTSGGACTVDNFEDAPVLQRLCQRVRNASTANCTSTPDITIIKSQMHECRSGAVGGVECDTELHAAEICELTEEVCDQYNSSGTRCLSRTSSFLCTSSEPMLVVGNPVGELFVSDPVITWSETCDADYADSRCVETASFCSVGPTVEDVNEVLVPMACVEQTTEYACAALTYTSDCSVFETDPGCSLESSVCYTMDPDGVCGAFEQVYQCGSGESQAFDASCEAVNVCVGGTCQSIPQEANDDLAPALIGVEMLNNMASEFEHDASIIDALLGNVDGDFEVQYFTATPRQCRIGILATIDCCADSGWGLGSIAECNASEVALYGAKQAGAAVYLETYCSNRLLFFCAQRSRRFCTYNSRIARIISEQGLRQLYGTFECRAMTQEEMEAIDFSLIDFSSAFADMFEGVGSIAPNDLSGLIQDNILLSQPEILDVYE